MSLLLRIFLIVLSLAFLFYVLLMVRRDRFLLKYSVVWVVLGVLGLIAAIFPQCVSWLSNLIGFETPVNFVFLTCILLLMTASLGFVSTLTKQSLLIKELIQELSILKSELEQRNTDKENQRAEASTSENQ